MSDVGISKNHLKPSFLFFQAHLSSRDSTVVLVHLLYDGRYHFCHLRHLCGLPQAWYRSKAREGTEWPPPCCSPRSCSSPRSSPWCPPRSSPRCRPCCPHSSSRCPWTPSPSLPCTARFQFGPSMENVEPCLKKWITWIWEFWNKLHSKVCKCFGPYL